MVVALTNGHRSYRTRDNVRLGSRLCENSDVELARRTFVSITLNRKRTALAVAVERGKGRKQFCAFSARARFHTGWVKTGKAQCEQMFSALPLKDGVIGRPSLWIDEAIWVLRFRLIVKRVPSLWRPQASEGEAQHGPFCWTGRFSQGDECLHCE